MSVGNFLAYGVFGDIVVDFAWGIFKVPYSMAGLTNSWWTMRLWEGKDRKKDLMGNLPFLHENHDHDWARTGWKGMEGGKRTGKERKMMP